jgi:drug/metabolite transporter (DMT)-like permease
LLGVAFVSAGIIALALERGPPRSKSTLAAIATGVFIAGYTLTDGLGARLSGHAPSYAAWLFVLQGAPMPLIWLAARGRLTIRLGDRETLKAMAGGVLSMLAYGVIIWALTLGPMGRISALRETSILFATVLGVAFLGERLTVRRAASAVMVAAGAIILAAGA